MTKLCGVAMLLLAVLTFRVGTANATLTSQACTVTSVGYNKDSTGQYIYIACAQRTNTFNAYVTQPPTGCTATDIDSLKLFESMATAAELSGRTATIWLTSCGTTSVVTSVQF